MEGLRQEFEVNLEQFDRMRSSQELSALAQTVLRDREEYWSELETLRITTALVLETLD